MWQIFFCHSIGWCWWASLGFLFKLSLALFYDLFSMLACSYQLPLISFATTNAMLMRYLRSPFNGKNRTSFICIRILLSYSSPRPILDKMSVHVNMTRPRISSHPISILLWCRSLPCMFNSHPFWSDTGTCSRLDNR